MVHGEEDSDDTRPKGPQDFIETVVPPAHKGWRQKRAPSPDDIPTERPPWSDPVESGERPQQGVVVPPGQKQA